MKEKLKQVLKNKDFWYSLIGSIGILLSILFSYTWGVKDGLLIDNSVRTELIDKVLNDTKNDKKNAYISGNTFNDCLGFKVSTYVGEVDNSSDIVYGYIPFYSVDYNFYLYYDFKLLEDNTFSFAITDCLLFVTITDIYDNTIRFYNGDIVYDALNDSLDMNKITDFYGFPTFSRLPLFNTSYINIPLADNYVLYTQPDIVIGDYYSLDFRVNSTPIFTGIDINYLNDLIGQFVLALLIYQQLPNVSTAYICVNSAYDLYNFQYYTHNGLLSLFNNGGGASEEDLQNAYNDGYNEGKIDGYNERKNSVEDSEQTINSIWSILEKAITSVLNVLSFEILPGIPLYVCIAVPILLCILLWVIKVGAS